MGRRGRQSLSVNRIPVYWVLFLSHPPARAHGKPALCPCTHMCSLCSRCQHQHRGILHLDMNTPCALTHLQAIINTMGVSSPLHWVHTHPSQSHTSKAHGLCVDRLGPQIIAWPPRPMERAGSHSHQPTRNSFPLYGILMLLKAKIVSLRASKPG